MKRLSRLPISLVGPRRLSGRSILRGRVTWSMVMRLLELLGPHAKAYGVVCLCGVVIAVLEMIPPKLVGHTINLMSKSNFEMPPILWMAAAWALVAVAVQLLHGVQIWLANEKGERVLSDLRARLFVHLQRLSMSFYDRTHQGRILTTSGSDIEAIRNVLIWGLNTVLANGAIMLCAAVMIFVTDATLFFATCWLAPAVTILNFAYGKKVAEAWQKVRYHSSQVGANQAENIAGVRVVVAFNRQERNLKHFNELQENNTSNNVMAARKAGFFQPSLQWVKFVGFAIILIYGGYRVATGQLAAGNLVSVILYWEWFMTPAVNFGAFFNELLVALSGAERVFALLDERPEVADPPGAPELPRLEGRVRFEGVSFRYRENGRWILQDVDFEVPPGSFVALVGATGSGKSSLMSLLARFYKPTLGRVTVDGYDINLTRGDSLHRQMAMVLQTNFLFTGTVMENLRYARPGATPDEIFEAARCLGCHERFVALKNGYDTEVGEKGSNLSLGERQLVCFTRALVADPRLLLLDEATSALDPLTGMQVQRAMVRLIKGRTAFIVTHRLSTIKQADLIVVVDQGRVREVGRHDELLARGGAYAELWNSSQRGSMRRAPLPSRSSKGDPPVSIS